MATARVKKRAGNMASLAYDQIRADIMNGVLPAGKPLSQLAIAKAVGTSRGPVREALRRLQQDQLVIARANQRFNVAPLDIADLEAVLSLQLANVTLASRISVPLLTDLEIKELKSFVDLMERGIKKEKWEDAFRGFTLTLVRHAGPRIESLVGHLLDNISRHRKSTLNNLPRVYSGGPEFRQIVEAAAARDGERVSALYADFASRMSTLILAGAAPHYDASRLRGYIVALVPNDKKSSNRKWSS